MLDTQQRLVIMPTAAPPPLYTSDAEDCTSRDVCRPLPRSKDSNPSASRGRTDRVFTIPLAEEPSLTSTLKHDQVLSISSMKARHSHAVHLVEGIMCTLLARPLEQLDIRHNSSLLEISESFRQLLDESETLLSKLQKDVETCVNRARAAWSKERRMYEAEIGRLRHCLEASDAAQTPAGCCSHSLDSQSMLKENEHNVDQEVFLSQKETIFEFLDHSAASVERGFDNQRGEQHP